MKKIVFNNKQIQEIISLYSDKHLSCKEIGKLYNCSKQVINKLIKESKIEVRDYSHCQQKYIINENIFDKIDTPEKSYWLGMLMGDGWVYDGAFGLSLQEKDKEHIFKFRDFLESNHPIALKRNRNKKDGTPSISYEIKIWNKQIVSSLKKYNICEDKTHKAIFPNNIPEEFLSNYMLGLIDSDGGFTIKQNKLYISFVSTILFTEKFQDILVKNCDINKTKLETQKSTDFIRIVSYGGNKQLLKICKYLYSNAIMFLPRKKQKAIEWLLSRYPDDEWLINV